MARSGKSYEERCTRPKLRERLKENIKGSPKGGERGKWSARKSQLLVKEYERQGGGYKEGANKDQAASLHTWTERDWQTSGGRGRARTGDTVKRYLPKAAWKRLSPEERERANKTKEWAEQRGQGRAGWTPAVRRVMRELDREQGDEQKQTKADLYVRAKQLGISGRSRMNKGELARSIRQRERGPKRAGKSGSRRSLAN